MKKIFSLIVLLTGIISMMSCSENDATYDSTEPLLITDADIIFTADGGDGSIVASTSSSIHAVTDAKWLSLATNGNTVTVSAQPNASLEARSAKIVLTADNGAQATMIATQHGLLLALNAQNSYMFSKDNSNPTIIADKSNITFITEISDDWIHVEKVFEGYAVTVDPNESGTYRHGSIKLSFPAKDFSKTINIGQWGDVYPFDEMNTAVYEDENGNETQKAVTVIANPDATKKNSYIIKGLMDEGDVVLLYNASSPSNNPEWYIASGYLVGTYTEGGTEYYLRCMMSATIVSTGKEFVPTTASESATTGYRMAFNWTVTDNGSLNLEYVRNEQLAATYSTNGFQAWTYKTKAVSATSRDKVIYTFLNFRLEKN